MVHLFHALLRMAALGLPAFASFDMPSLTLCGVCVLRPSVAVWHSPAGM